VKVLVKTVTEWVRDLVVISLVFAFAEMLLPANDLRRFGRVVMGITLIAAIVGSILDISGAMDDALKSQAGFALGQTDTWDRQSWAAKGELIAYQGLQIAGVEAEKRFTRQLESIARLASGADEAHARIEFTSGGDVKHIHVALRGFSALDFGFAGDDSRDQGAYALSAHRELSTTIEKRVINEIQDFYGFSRDVAISVTVDFP
jgi:stage III sporulation protein AF